MELRPLTDDALMSRLEILVHRERESVADIVEHLAEVDRRELALDRGYATLFEYCVRKLRYSEAAAFLRIRAARASAAFPRVLDDLRSGAIHLDAVMRLYPYLDKQNCDSLLDQAAGLSKREVLALTVRLGGGEAVPERDVIRVLPTPSAQPSLGPAVQNIPVTVEKSGESCGVHAVVVVSPPRIRLSFTADDGLLVKIDRLRGFLHHKFPAGRLEDVLGEAVSALLERIDPGRLAARRRNSMLLLAAKTKRRWRRVPAIVKAEVWKRDGGRCAYVAEDGCRCEAKQLLEYDHIVPYALGGASDTASNIRLLCRPHNQRLARLRFGPRRRA